MLLPVAVHIHTHTNIIYMIHKLLPPTNHFAFDSLGKCDLKVFFLFLLEKSEQNKDICNIIVTAVNLSSKFTEAWPIDVMETLRSHTIRHHNAFKE